MCGRQTHVHVVRGYRTGALYSVPFPWKGDHADPQGDRPFCPLIAKDGIPPPPAPAPQRPFFLRHMDLSDIPNGTPSPHHRHESRNRYFAEKFLNCSFMSAHRCSGQDEFSAYSNGNPFITNHFITAALILRTNRHEGKGGSLGGCPPPRRSGPSSPLRPRGREHRPPGVPPGGWAGIAGSTRACGNLSPSCRSPASSDNLTIIFFSRILCA